MTWEIFKEICRSKEGKSCLIGLFGAAVVAIATSIFVKNTSIFTMIQIGCALVVWGQTQKFAGICQMAVNAHMTEEKKLEQYKKGYIRRDDD